MEKNKLLILFSLWIPSLMNHRDLENARGFYLWAKGYTVSSLLAPMLCPTPFLIHTRLTWSIVSWPNDVSISPTTYTSSVESSLPCYYVLSHFVHSLLVILKSQTLMTYEKIITQMEETGSWFRTMCSSSFITLVMWTHFHELTCFQPP